MIDVLLGGGKNAPKREADRKPRSPRDVCRVPPRPTCSEFCVEDDRSCARKTDIAPIKSTNDRDSRRRRRSDPAGMSQQTYVTTDPTVLDKHLY